MADETIRRLFDKIDSLREQVARLETMLEEKEKVCEMKFGQLEKLDTRVSILERSRSFFSGGFGFLAWIISTVLMVLGVMYK